MAIQTELINRLSEISANYDVFILPYLGVISDGESSYPDIANIMARIKHEGKKNIILANSASRVDDLQQKLYDIEIYPDLYDGILTSGEVSYHELAMRQSPFFKNLGTCYYHIGRLEDRNSWIDIGYIPVDNMSEAEFIIVSGSETKQDAIERYLPILRNAANMGLQMLCVNPDRNMALPESDDVGAGYIASRYEAMGGIVHYRGKPQKDFFEYCLEGFPNIDKSRFLMISNTFSFDIKGASDVGIDSLLIGIGTHARELGLALGKTLTEQNVNELSRHYGLFPSYVTTELKY